MFELIFRDDKEQLRIIELDASAKWMVHDAWVYWLMNEFGSQSMITLTYDTDRANLKNLSLEKSWGLVKKWIHEVNTAEIGKNYKNKFRHSYFSYFAVREYQQRGTVHYHLLVDNYIDYRYSNAVWNQLAGRIKSRSVHHSEGAIRYMVKYMVKEDVQPVIWMVKNKYVRNKIDLNAGQEEYLQKRREQRESEKLLLDNLALIE